MSHLRGGNKPEWLLSKTISNSNRSKNIVLIPNYAFAQNQVCVDLRLNGRLI